MPIQSSGRPDRAASHRRHIEGLESRRLLSAGDPDHTFGIGGQLEYPSPHQHVTGLVDTVVLPDGKFLQGGHAERPHYTQQDRYFLRRLNADGSLDATFGTNGTVLGTFTTNPDARLTVRNMAVAPDGKIYLVGNFDLARFHADGSLDRTFGGGDGLVDIDSVAPLEMSVQPDGKLLFLDDVGGVTRYLPTGALDTAFGVNGTAAAIPSVSPKVNGMVVRVLPDGKLLVGGRAPGPSGRVQSALARLNEDGSLDASFGDGGRVLNATPGSRGENNHVSDIVLLPGGKFLAGGATLDRDTGVGGFVLARYDAGGTLDRSFGSSGVARVRLGEATLAQVLLDADGNAVLIGRAGSTVVARVTPDGELDETLGRVVARGFADPGVQAGAMPGAAVVQGDGKLVIVGQRAIYADVANVNTTFVTRLHMKDDGVETPVSLAGGVLTITGTPARELLSAYQTSDVVFGVRRGYGRAFDAADVARVDLFAREGDDYVIAEHLTSIPARVVAGLGHDKVVGGGGDDTLEGSGGNDSIDAGAGNDVVNGGNGQDALRGLDGDDTLQGAAGDDELRGGAGIDANDGGPGNNVVVDVQLPGVTLDDDGVLRFVGSDVGDDQVSLWADGAGGLVVWVGGVTDTIDIGRVREISLRGLGGNNLLKLNPGLDIRATLASGGGNDTLIGGAHSDEMYGGAGDDLLVGNAGHDAMPGHEGNDVLRGGEGSDIVDGAAGNDRLDGGAGDDIVIGGAGHDVLFGGLGADDILGLAGNDVLLADDGVADTVDGGLGTDVAEADDQDGVLAVETVS